MKKKHHITDLISQGEHQQLDFKFEVTDSKKIARIKYHVAKNILSDMLAIGSLGYSMRDNQIVYGVREQSTS